MKIIPADIKHLDAIQNLSKELILDDYTRYDKSIKIDWSHSEKWEKFFKAWILEDKNIIYLAIDWDTVVGYIYWGIYCTASWRHGPEYIAELYNFFVQDTYRWKWLGYKLYDEFEKWCFKKEVDTISVVASAENEQVKKLYKKNWFEEYTTTLEKSLKK